LFGFVVEGRPDPTDVDPYAIPTRGFRVADPTGREQADRSASMKRLMQRMGPPRRYRMRDDGTVEEIRDADA
jgi:hypothetical protein